MSDLEYLKSRAKKYDLTCDFVNEDVLKVYSKKYDFDSWLIKDTEYGIELWHMNKGGSLNKCTYHLQKTVSRKNKHWVLERINSHNRYVAFHKRKKYVNLVDEILRGDKR